MALSKENDQLSYNERLDKIIELDRIANESHAALGNLLLKKFGELKDKEIERLKGLISQVWWQDHSPKYFDNDNEASAKRKWQQFAKENNIE